MEYLYLDKYGRLRNITSKEFYSKKRSVTKYSYRKIVSNGVLLGYKIWEVM